MVVKHVKENWRNILKGIGLFLLLFFLWLLFFPGQEDFLNTGPPDMKRIELEDVKIVGYNKGKRTWEISARYVWAPRNTDRATLEYISNGKAYNKGRLILTDLQARKVIANSNTERLVAQEGVKAYLIRKGKKASDLEERISIWAENMIYNGQEKRSVVRGSIRVQQKDAGVYGDKAEIDHDKDTVLFEAPFKIIQKNIYLTADKLKTFLDEERFILEGQAKIIRKKEDIATRNIEKREIVFKKEDLQINADKIDFISSNGKAKAKITGHIVVAQPGKKAFGDSGYYDEEADYVELYGASQAGLPAEAKAQAGMILDEADWLLDKNTLDGLKDPKTRETFSKQTTILADKIRMRIEDKDALAVGKVKVKQKGKLAYADKAYYVEKDDHIRLKGNVRFQRSDGTWLNAEEALISLKDNTFQAVGEVETNIILEK